MHGELRVASTQVRVVDGDMAANRRAALAMAKRVAAAEKGVDLILFHEGFLESGCEFDDIDRAVSEENLSFWKDVAAQTGIAVLAGRLERRGDGGLYNMATAISSSGEILADFAKMHLFNAERDALVPGDELGMFELNGVRVGIMICADFGFPELARAYAQHGVHVLAVSSSWAYPDDDLWEICNRARSAENGIYVVSCDRVGPTSRGLVKVGRSMMCDPNGFVVANLAETVDTYFVGTVRAANVDARHADMKWLEWVRPEVYARL